MVGVAAVVSYLGLGAQSLPITPAYAQRAAPIRAVLSVPELSSLIGQDKKPDASQQEKDLAAKAENFYNEGNAWQALHPSKPLYGIDRLKVFQESYRSFVAAENADASSEKFKDGIAKSQDRLTQILFEYLTGEKDAAKAGGAYSLVKDDMKSDADSKKRLAELLKKFKIDPDAKQEPKQDPALAKKENDQKYLAESMYADAASPDKWKAGPFSDDRIQAFKNAYQAFKWAEDIDPSSRKFGDYFDKNIPDWLAFIALSRMENEADSKKVKEWHDAYSAFDGKDCFAALKIDAHKQKLDDLLKMHGIQHKPYFVKPEEPKPGQDPQVKPEQKPDKQPEQKPDQKPDPQPEQKPDTSMLWNPHVDRIIARADIGSFKSSQDRGFSLDAKLYGVHLLADAYRNRFREAESGDKIVETGFGGAASLNLEDLSGLPFSFGASFEERTRARSSFEFDETDSAAFNIKTFTDTNEETADKFLAAYGRFRLWDVNLGFTGFRLEETIDVDVLTRLEVINKSDPSGNYTDFIPTSLSFTNEALGGQFLLAYDLSKQLQIGGLFTAEMLDLKDFDRTTERYRLHMFGRYLSENRRYGASVMGALMNLVDDEGEERDRFDKAEWNLVGGAEIADWLTIGGRFSYRENPRGSLMFLLGRSPGALEHILDNAWVENLAELDLLKHLSADQQKVYLRGRHEDLIKALAAQNRWLLYGDVGAARVSTIDGEEVVFNGRATLFMPIGSDITLTFAPYINHSNLFKHYGLEMGLYPTDSRWAFVMDVSKEEFPGRKEEEEEFRGIVGARFSLDKPRKK